MKQKIFQNFYQNIEQYEYSIDELNNNWINDNDIVGHNQNPDENTINQIMGLHNLFCYSVQNIGNDNINNKIIVDYKNFKILTSTPSYFTV